MLRTNVILFRRLLLAAVMAALLLPVSRVAAAEKVDIGQLMFQPSVNLVLSVADVAKSKHFFGDVLGLKPMSDLHLPLGLVMTRYQVGTTQIKLLHLATTRKTETGKINEATGIRRLTLFFPEAQELIDRFEAHDLPAPQFETEPTPRGWSRAIVNDPDGSEIELIVPPPGTPDAVYQSIELRLTVGELESSREFYGEFVGFEPLDPVHVPPAEGSELFGYRRGNTTIVLASFGAELPKHSGRWQDAHGIRYIQYIVKDLDTVSDFAKASGVTIDQPIFALGRLARIMFIADPDGIINEFVGLPKAGK